MRYVKICPKCGSMMVKKVFDKKKMRFVNKCLDCSFLGDKLFKGVSIEELKVRK